MRRLLLLRHAKSDWPQDVPEDHERPLSERGRRDAPKVGRWLREHRYLPGEVLSSPARRTRQTWDLLGFDDPAPNFIDALYHATPGTLEAALRGAAAEAVMIIGHNPGLGAFAADLATKPPPHREFGRFPTAAAAVIDFAIAAWTELRPGTGRVTDFVVPKDL